MLERCQRFFALRWLGADLVQAAIDSAQIIEQAIDATQREATMESRQILEDSEFAAVKTLNVCSVISIFFGIVAALTIWITMGWQYKEGSRVSTEANPVGIILGAVFLFGGIVQYAVLVAIGSMVENLRSTSKTNLKLLEIIETQQKPTAKSEAVFWERKAEMERQQKPEEPTAKSESI